MDIFDRYARVRILDNIEEDPDYPEGVSSQELSEMLKNQSIARLFLPADLMPDSKTSVRIRRAGIDLDERYIVYKGERRGCGHDSTYG
jgi:hypothetical protein